jgi:uncharacterized protein (TIGR02687 family)
MSERIYEALDRHFAKHRIVFWYDPLARMREIYEGYTRAGIVKVELANDEFQVKHRLTRIEPAGKFLVYSPKDRPLEAEDWLLDLALGHFVFCTDEAAMYLQDLGLSVSLRKLVAERKGFFRDSKDRLEPLAALAKPEWEAEDLLYAMLSIASSRTKSERQAIRSLDDILVSLCVDDEAGARWTKVVEWKLDHVFFEKVQREFGITLDSPEPRGLLLRLFQNALAFQTGEQRTAEPQRAFVFIDGWRDAKSETERYETCSRSIENEIKAKDFLAALPDDRLIRVDIYMAADHVLISRIVTALVSGRADLSKTLERIKERKSAYWYRNDHDGELKAWYDALEAACLLERSVRAIKKPSGFGAPTKQSLWDLYTTELHKIDRLYRNFVLAYQSAGSGPELATLLGKIDDLYLNGFLDPLSLRWQSFLDADSSFGVARRQNTFFASWVDSYLKENKILFVIISDGLRWEAGAELAERLLERNRFKVDLESLVALVPTVTPHGMAALLPHANLCINPNTSAVLIDGLAVNGVDGRGAYLNTVVSARYPGKKARAISADALLSLSSSDADHELKDFDLVYVYSDHIDSASHASDSSVPMAVDREIDRIIDLIRRITNLNRSNILVTADHGFLFSGNASDETHMLSIEEMQGETFRDRRFILGLELAEKPGLGRYSAPEPAFASGTTALVAKGLSKIRKKGNLGRYVHGGASLQELAIPVLRINKTRQDDASRVAVSVMGSNNITSPSITLKFYQDEPVGGKVLSHRIGAWFESADGQILSNKVDRIFDSDDASDMNRSISISFVFAPVAKKQVGKEIYLRIYTIADGGTLIDPRTMSFKLKQLALDIDFF